MKTFFVFILLWLNSMLLLACGPFYPSGDDIRYNFLKPEWSEAGRQYYYFNYTASLYYNERGGYPNDINTNITSDQKYDEYVESWYKVVQYKISRDDIYEFLYISNDTSNAFYQYFSKQKNTAYLEYLNFLIHSERLNDIVWDPWERGNAQEDFLKYKAIQMAMNNADKTKNMDLKGRYLFLAIRLAYYAQDEIQVNHIFESFFQKNQQHDLYYHALFFKIKLMPTSPERNFLIAMCFYNTSRSYVLIGMYDKEIEIQKTLSFCNNNVEKSKVYFIHGIRNPDKCFQFIKDLYDLNPDHKIMEFLLLREVNKLEDWIYTPYYTNFNYSLVYTWYDDTITDAQLNENIKSDQKYALAMAQWLEKLPSSVLQNQQKEILTAYLFQLAGKTKIALDLYLSTRSAQALSPWNVFCDKMIFLCQMKLKKPNLNQWSATNHKDFNQWKSDRKWLFALARDYEYAGDFETACILFAHIPRDNDQDYENILFWRSVKQANYIVDYYTDYLRYIDLSYPVKVIEKITNFIEKNKNSKDNAIKDIFKPILSDRSLWYDLLGTKYIRHNALPQALTAFSKVHDSLWTSQNYQYHYYLHANPFYTNFYKSHNVDKNDSVYYNKKTLVQQLLFYLNKANNSKEPNRDYYYFLVANAYFNMTHYGNSWMMRRYFWSSYDGQTDFEDDKEYMQCLLAASYYEKAKKYARNSSGKALALRMRMRCEHKKLVYREFVLSGKDNYRRYDERLDSLYQENRYRKELEKNFQNDYDELVSNCESFESYWRKWRKM